LNANPELQWQILNKNINQKNFKCVISKTWDFPYVSIVNEAPGASFTKLTYLSDLSFGNFLLPNAHNFVK
jgi:hypothetical protein